MTEIYGKSVRELLYTKLGPNKEYQIEDVIEFKFEHLRLPGRPTPLVLTDLLMLIEIDEEKDIRFRSIDFLK
jgi:hypothetical protein